ncbi:MAG: autotransporter domain-containing protein, partial [Azoarcus sp.]|nr:autotransporter domain-containing protein [Azoarcus sp.]
DNNTHIIGGESNNGAVYGNTVEITGVEAGTTNTTNKVIYGGYIYNGSSDVTVNKTISDNHVTVKNVIASGAAIRGGEADIHAAKTGSSVDVSNNSVTLSGKSFAPTVYGGNTDLGNATGNSVSIDTTITNTFTTVTGGVATGNASANEVTLSNQGTFTTVTGGNATTATATDADNNKVTIAGKAPASDGPYVLTVGSVTGGKTVSTAATASASGNKLTVANATISAITGGDATSAGSASDNIIELDKANVTGAITGGLSKTLAQGNAITIKNAEVGVVTGGQTTDGNANDNHVTITDSTISGAIIGGDAHTATTASSGSANGNVIELDNVKIVSKITGGYGKTLAQGNTITIKNAEVGAVTGGQTVDGDVIDNHVTIINSTITGNVYAGQPGNLATDKATGNSVTLENVKIDSSDAAITVSAAQIAADNATGDATGNTVTLAGKIELSGSNNVSLKSVNVTGSSPVNDAYTGNTLEVRDYEAVGTKVFSEISGFENYNFYFENVPLGSDPVLEATEVKLDNAAGTKNAQVKLSLAGQAATLKLGDQVQLFHETAGGEISGASAATLSITQGATLQYSGSLDANGALNVTSVSTTPSSKALSEGALAGVALLTQGADLAVDKGIAAALRATSTPGLSGFAAVGGGSLRYDTGSHVQVDGFSLLAGLSFGTALAPGKLTVGAFFEYGSGDYDTSNSFATGKIKGSGDTEYTGGGLLARLDFTGTEAGHFYGEATGRLGKVESDFSSAGLQNQATKYDAEGAYYGLHLGAGYVWKLSGQSELDVYGKYLWSHQKGDSVRLNTGDPVEFDDVNSHRLRLGARLNWQAGERFSPYAGLAYEQELDGEAKATAYGQAIEAPDLKGGTAIGEFGLSFQAGEAVTLDLGVQGYTGKRDGVTGSLKLKVAF